jgi:hypothetical protein
MGRRLMRWTIALIALALAACKTDSPNGPAGPVDLRVVLGPGQQTAVPGAGAIRFEGVANDSRCPGDAICVWAGDATVRVVVSASGGASASYELHTADLKPVQHRDVTIALEALSPYPFASKGPIPPGDYRVTLKITR